jgi:hypothetical protein
MAVVKTAPKSVAAEALNRLIAQKASTKIPITIRAQPIPMRKGRKEYHLPSGNPKRFWRDPDG